MTTRGKLIVIDGFDGVGKSTQIELLHRRLCQEGNDIIKLKFPNYEEESSYFVKKYLEGRYYNTRIFNEDINTAKGISMIYAMDRHNTFYKETNDYKRKGFHRLIDILDSGTHIICDRYTTSNMLLQGAKFPKKNMDDSIELIDFIYEMEYDLLKIPKPDSVIVLKIPVELSLELLSKTGKDLDIHETEQYQKKCHSFFDRLITEKKLRYITNTWSVIDCYTKMGNTLLPIETINNLIYSRVKSILNSNAT